jgi:hypothetical protein
MCDSLRSRGVTWRQASEQASNLPKTAQTQGLADGMFNGGDMNRAGALCQLCKDEGLLKGYVQGKRDVPEEARVPSPHGAPCAKWCTNLWFITRVAALCAIDQHYPISLRTWARRSSQPSLSTLAPRPCHNQSQTLRVSHSISLTQQADWRPEVDST